MIITQDWASASSGDDTAALLVSASARLTRLYGKALGQLQVPLTFRQHRLLMRVAQGHTTLASLAAFGNLTLPTVSESVDVLVRRGLVTRQGNPDNRRSLTLSLTEQGEAANEAAESALTDLGRNLLHDVSENQRDVLHDALSKIFNAATSYFLVDDHAQHPVNRSRNDNGTAATHHNDDVTGPESTVPP